MLIGKTPYAVHGRFSPTPFTRAVRRPSQKPAGRPRAWRNAHGRGRSSPTWTRTGTSRRASGPSATACAAWQPPVEHPVRRERSCRRPNVRSAANRLKPPGLAPPPRRRHLCGMADGTAFDTLAAARRPKAARFNDAQAEAIWRAVHLPEARPGAPGPRHSPAFAGAGSAIDSPAIPADSLVIPADSLVIPADKPVIPANDSLVIPAKAGICFNGLRLPASAGMTIQRGRRGRRTPFPPRRRDLPPGRDIPSGRPPRQRTARATRCRRRR